MTIKREARLENWYIGNGWGIPIKNGDAVNGNVLWGDVYGHPDKDDPTRTVQDGTFVRTSYIVDADVAAGWVQTKNTLYKLGAPKAFEPVPDDKV